jgi:2-keto-4-pentenoate hydratase/2-oxohepta-3-ene-1,7-dioic acid hydratase in catechol pathway
MDYELEIAPATKRTRASIPAAEGAAHIFGYTIFNDFSARDRQSLEMQGRLGRPSARASTAPMPWARGSSPPGRLSARAG